MTDNMPADWECEREIKLARLAYRLAHNQLDADDAQDLILMMQPIAGWYGLATICVEDVMESLTDRYDNDPAELLPLAEDAAARVGSKWDDGGETVSSALDWARDLVAEYASDEGIVLIEAEGSADDEDE